MRAGKARILAIGDTGAGVRADVLTAAVVVACTVCAAIGVVAGAVFWFTELAGRASSEWPTTGAGDAVCADEPSSAV